MKKRSEKPKIIIRNLTGRQIPGARSIKRIIEKVLRTEGAGRRGLSVTYVTDGRIRSLNKKHMGHDRVTDVLAFSMTEGVRLEGAGDFLGDIIISVDAARRQAAAYNSTSQIELKLYLIHGVLHLLGYDDTDPAGFDRMKDRQEEILRRA